MEEQGMEDNCLRFPGRILDLRGPVPVRLDAAGQQRRLGTRQEGYMLPHHQGFTLSWLQRTCAGQHQHVPIEGYVPGLGLRSEVVESYPPRLAKRLAQLLVLTQSSSTR